ncbi:hypothetical protein EYF80_061980 [Liparis tanakae]|uniref:Uncharacterized protein n=1 Tax=Liparis tanakae TaxID=230148 RepID=A0A4Z2EGG3_9TELE|nr:hypothetical protein EYF80_061980 [Liparis tanakae]
MERRSAARPRGQELRLHNGGAERDALHSGAERWASVWRKPEMRYEVKAVASIWESSPAAWACRQKVGHLSGRQNAVLRFRPPHGVTQPAEKRRIETEMMEGHEFQWT